MEKDRRIRDFVHGLIVFRVASDVDRIAWKLINTREFQRLRRIRQLGFSEFVYPGATHTRFSHSIGVYHTARLLLERIRQIAGSVDATRARVALLAALLHDVGHGPFSHAFKKVQENIGIHVDHEEWSSRIIEGDTEIHAVLVGAGGSGLANEIGAVIKAEGPRDIYSSIVSSQFDADRLDYLRRDRYMTGTGLGGFDFDWLLDCLVIDKLTMGEKEDFDDITGLCLNHKGLQAAEGYLLSRFHLYSQVYLHKTTRAAEQILMALLKEASTKVRSKDRKACPIPSEHPIAKFLSSSDPTVSEYVQLDDFSIWGAVNFMQSSSDPYIADMSKRLLERRLFKCFDAGAVAGNSPGTSLNRLRRELQKLDGTKDGLLFGRTVLTDKTSVTAYGVHDFGDRDVLQNVLIHANESAGPTDISEHSDVVKAIGEMRVERHYVPDDKGVAALERIWAEVSK